MKHHKLIELIKKIKIKRYIVPGECVCFPLTINRNVHKDEFVGIYTHNVDILLSHIKQTRGEGLVPAMMCDIYDSWFPPITEVPKMRRKQFNDIVTEIGKGDLSRLMVLREFLIDTARYNHVTQRKLNVMSLIHRLDEIEYLPTKTNVEQARYYHIFCKEMGVAVMWDIPTIVSEIKKNEFENFLKLRKVLECELDKLNNESSLERFHSIKRDVVNELKKKADAPYSVVNKFKEEPIYDEVPVEN